MFQHLRKLKDFLKSKLFASKDTAASLPPPPHIPVKPQIAPPDKEVHPAPAEAIPKVPLQPAKQESFPQKTTVKTDGLSVQEITLGLDFGTSATKCIINFENYDKQKDKYFICAFPSSSVDAFTLCYPTAIGIKDECFVFGHRTDLLPEKQIIRSIKMAIPCIENDWGSYKSPFMMKEKPGYFTINGTCFSAIDLSALYLSYFIKHVKDQIISFLGQGSPYQIYLNMAAPMDQLITQTDRFMFLCR